MLPPESDCANFKPLVLAPNPPFRDSSNYSSPLPTGFLLCLSIRVLEGRGREKAPASFCLLIFLSLLSCNSPVPSQQYWLQSPAPFDTNKSPTNRIKQQSLLRNLTSCSWGSSSITLVLIPSTSFAPSPGSGSFSLQLLCSYWMKSGPGVGLPEAGWQNVGS